MLSFTFVDILLVVVVFNSVLIRLLLMQVCVALLLILSLIGVLGVAVSYTHLTLPTICSV